MQGVVMRSKKNKVTAEHIKFREAIAQYAEAQGAIPLADGGPWQMHHVVGGSYVQDKVHIGEWFLLPIESEFHDPGSNNPLNVTHFRSRFTKQFGDQRVLFLCMVKRMEDMGLLVPPPRVMEAIMRTRR
jgi:hypothetical protein